MQWSFDPQHCIAPVQPDQAQQQATGAPAPCCCACQGALCAVYCWQLGTDFICLDAALQWLRRQLVTGPCAAAGLAPEDSVASSRMGLAVVLPGKRVCVPESALLIPTALCTSARSCWWICSARILTSGVLLPAVCTGPVRGTVASRRPDGLELCAPGAVCASAVAAPIPGPRCRPVPLLGPQD